MQQSTPYLSFHGITMTFPGVKALSDISFGCYAGQVHALMGENGVYPHHRSAERRGGHYLSGAASDPGNDRGGKYLPRAAAA